VSKFCGACNCRRQPVMQEVCREGVLVSMCMRKRSIAAYRLCTCNPLHVLAKRLVRQLLLKYQHALWHSSSKARALTPPTVRNLQPIHSLYHTGNPQTKHPHIAKGSTRAATACATHIVLNSLTKQNAHYKAYHGHCIHNATPMCDNGNGGTWARFTHVCHIKHKSAAHGTGQHCTGLAAQLHSTYRACT
jgi:hypothetical protein